MDYVFGKEGRNDGHKVAAVAFLAQDGREREVLDGPVFGRQAQVVLHAPQFVVVADVEGAFVGAAHVVVVEGQVGRHEPVGARHPVGVGLHVALLAAAAGVGDVGAHGLARREVVVAVVLPEVASANAHVPLVERAVPADHGAGGVVAVLVLEVGVVLIVDAQKRQSAQAVGVPAHQSDAVPLAVAVVDVLHGVHVVEVSALVPLRGVAQLVVVGVLEVVLRGGVDQARAAAPVLVAVGVAQELVERAERTGSLDVLQAMALVEEGQRVHVDGAAQSASGEGERRGAVKQVGLVDEVGRNGAEVDGAEHGRVDFHAVPQDLCVAGRGAPEFGCRLGGAPVAFDEERGVLREDVGHGEGHVLVEHQRVEDGSLHAGVAQSPLARHLHLVKIHGQLTIDNGQLSSAPKDRQQD